MKKYTKIICIVAAVCLLGTAAFCGFRIYSHYAHESEQEEVFEKIAEVVEQAQTGESETTVVLLTEEETVLAEYGELYLQNTDMVGWLSIAGTNINYPVMQTPNNPNFYLKHNFEKEYSDLGTPYVQENCDLLTSDSGRNRNDCSYYSCGNRRCDVYIKRQQNRPICLLGKRKV